MVLGFSARFCQIRCFIPSYLKEGGKEGYGRKVKEGRLWKEGYGRKVKEGKKVKEGRKVKEGGLRTKGRKAGRLRKGRKI
jgi:hypothetical protein